ncbi:hypothetical protein EUGRSUZ_E04061 [Eucalyptus grandis]|uniref:Uncharacterized protein n=2 Tax=Eucalyptus grandis TaxID=71139 RepID=A0ACC3L0P7_EUCGR|nr:hypothetical protein EUGRSUZ_E04061 [Eucalyptus grandis]
MGNCCRAESSSSTIWAGDDWNSLPRDGGEGKKGLLDDADGKRVSSSSSRRREIKIQISKKDLEKLVHKIEAQGLSLEQVLPLLINKNTFNRHQLGFTKHGCHRSWRPALQSIPEAI